LRLAGITFSRRKLCTKQFVNPDGGTMKALMSMRVRVSVPFVKQPLPL